MGGVMYGWPGGAVAKVGRKRGRWTCYRECLRGARVPGGGGQRFEDRALATASGGPERWGALSQPAALNGPEPPAGSARRLSDRVGVAWCAGIGRRGTDAERGGPR